MREIPYSMWERREYADFYNVPDLPYYSITANINVGPFCRYVKRENIPFYYAMIYVTMNVINRMDDFKYRLRGEHIVLHDTLTPSFTVLEKNSRLHKIVNAPIRGDMKEYCVYAGEKAAAQTQLLLGAKDESRDDFVYVSCVPWVSYTSLTNTMGFDKDDFIPRIAWGKFFEEPASDRLLLPYSMQVNHRANDGLHVGEFYQGLQAELDGFS